MKKYLIFLTFILGLIGVQKTANAQAFSTQGVHMDLGYIVGSYSGNILSPGVLLSFEKGVHKWIGIGGYVGSQYVITSKNSSAGYLSISPGISGYFHFYQMIADLTGANMAADKLDISVKHTLGFRTFLTNPVVTGFDFGIAANLRYYFTNSFGVYVEAGVFSSRSLVVGLAFKF